MLYIFDITLHHAALFGTVGRVRTPACMVSYHHTMFRGYKKGLVDPSPFAKIYGEQIDALLEQFLFGVYKLDRVY